MNTLKVAVIGASGIGKNHAGWLHRHGCEVCAFVGSSSESVARTQEVLRDKFGFNGRGYSDVAAMLREEDLDAICVSSPPALHFEAVTQCLRAGLHVLCEKPLVYDAYLGSDEILRQANQLIETARQSGKILAMQTQYVTLVPQLLALCDLQDAAQVRTFKMEMETKQIKADRGGREIWIDLSPHPLSVLQFLAQDGEIVPNSIKCDVGEHETETRFAVARADGSTIESHIIVRVNPNASTPLRRFSLNGQAVDYAGKRDDAGDFRTFLTAPDGTRHELPDLVDILIGNFVRACRGEAAPMVTGEDGAQNVAWQLKILDAAT